MVKLTSLLSELTFRNQDAFDKYNSAHKLRNSTKVTINGKKTTAGEAEKKSKPSTKKKTNIFDEPKKDDSKTDVKKDKKRGFLDTTLDLLFGKPTDDNKSDTKPDVKKKKKPRRHITVGAPYAEKPEFWENQFEIGDEDSDIGEIQPWQYSSWNMMKIAGAAMDFCKDDDKLKTGTTAKDYGYLLGLSDDSAGYEQSIVCKTKSGELGPIALRLSSPDADGHMNITIGYNEQHKLGTDGSQYTEDDNILFSIVSGDQPYWNGDDKPELTYQKLRTIMLYPETAKLLRGEITPEEYAPLFKEISKSLDAADQANHYEAWPPGDHNNGWNEKKKKKDNKNESIRLSGILSEISDDELLNKTIRYKDSMGRDKEIKMKTALSKTYQTAKEPGMQNAYRTAKQMWDNAHKSGDKPNSDRKPNRATPVQKQEPQNTNGNDLEKKSNNGAPVQNKEPQKISGSDLKTSAEKDKNIGMKGGPGSGRTATDLPMLRDLMPNANFDRKPLSAIAPIERQQISTIIDKLAELGKQARERGENAPNFNLCQVSVPGTNLYCDGNKGIPREDMPQFKGTPEPGSPADKLPKDKNGEVDTEEFFKKMLEKQGIKVSEPASIKPDRLKATQSELVGPKVAGMEKALEENPQHPAITAPIYVSNDGYVLDGHHRWAAIVAYNAAHPDKPIPMQVRVIDEPIEPLVKRSNAFAEEMGIRAKKADTGAAGGPSPITK